MYWCRMNEYTLDSLKKLKKKILIATSAMLMCPPVYKLILITHQCPNFNGGGGGGGGGGDNHILLQIM